MRNNGSSFHSSYVSKFKLDKQHTAVLSLPKWSFPVGRVISAQRLDVLTTNPSFLWTPNTYLNSDTLSVPRSTPIKNITYIAKLTGIGGCSITDTIFIKVLLAPTIPNVFSPNGDGILDVWEIQYLESYPGATIDVFDRGGRLLYSSINYAKQWDGKFNGNPLPVGTYYYIINPKNGRNVISGSVTIIK